MLPGTDVPAVPSGPRPLTENGRLHPQPPSHFPSHKEGDLRGLPRRASLPDDWLIDGRPFGELPAIIAGCISDQCRAIGTDLIGDINEIEMSAAELSRFRVHLAVQRAFVVHPEWGHLMRFPHGGSPLDAAAGYTDARESSHPLCKSLHW